MRIVLLCYHKVVVWSRIHFCFVQYLRIFKWKLIGKYKNTILCRGEVYILCALMKGTWLNSVGLILEKADFYLGFKYQSALIEAFIEQGHEALEGPWRDQIKCFLAKAFLKKGEFLVKNTHSQQICKPFFFQNHSPLNTYAVYKCTVQWAIVPSTLVFPL